MIKKVKKAFSKIRELDKILLNKEKSEIIGLFLEWLQDEDYVICEHIENKIQEKYYPIGLSIEEILAKYFNIDLKKCEEERRKLLKKYQEK